MNILKMLGGGQGDMLAQALIAKQRGESPNAFLKRMSKTNPQLQKINLDNLEESAKKLCREKNVNVDEALGKAETLMKQ